MVVKRVHTDPVHHARPSARPSQSSQKKGTHPPAPTPVKSQALDLDPADSSENKRWSDTQSSNTPSRARAHSIEPRARRSTSASESSTALSRSNSFSTIDAGLNPATGAYKVIIDQPNVASSSPPGAAPLPAIEVPIPHYRLGTPRFSTRGTAFLHSTVYSTSSMHDDSDSVKSGESAFPLPAAVISNPRGAQHQQHTDGVPELHTVHVDPSVGPKRFIPTSTPIFHRSREPIVPGIYDAIASNPDNPAIVRYAIMSNREISAASPSRIIAQITSKNFLDYELLSDFFLTVRAYLSTHDLLAYLLARFEWAINRFDDDGRVIRVRAFAAIRHWVLNYFPYDFVVDRDLRVKFCQRLNSLARHVRKRASQEPSDLKLISDLKKCWNGRCALYWDNPYVEYEGRHDLDISPGGIVGSRDSRLTHPSELWAKLAASSSHQVDQEKSVAALHNWVDSVIEAEVDGRSKTERQGSVTALQSPPTVASSESTIQPTSCTVPAKAFKSLASQPNRANGQHPVPSHLTPGSRKTGPPIRSGPAGEKMSPRKAEHDRSGSFSDALRDKRTSLPMGADQSKEQVVVNVPFSGSLIRGNVFPPGSPFIENVHSQGSGSNSQKNTQYARVLDGNPIDSRPMSPGVRNLLANLRRAWGSRQSSHNPNPALLSTAPFPAEKNAALPMHIAFKIEGFGDQHHQLEALKKNSRIDLLCADITAVFERIVTQAPLVNTRAESDDEDSEDEDEDEDNEIPAGPPQEPLRPRREVLTRNHSAVTNGSRSIVIVDDTSSEPPVPNVPLEYHEPPPTDYSVTSAQLPFSLSEAPHDPLPAPYEPLVAPNPSGDRADGEGDTQPSDLLPDFTRPSLPSPPRNGNIAREPELDVEKAAHKSRPSLAAGKSFRSNRSDSQSLRRYVSYQSGMRRSGVDHVLDAGSAGGSPLESSPGSFDQEPKQMLRRRPGGDLRANQTVHDLEPMPRPRSTGSITTYTESIHHSLKRSADDPAGFQSPQIGHSSPLGVSPPVAKANPQPRPDSPRKDRRPSFEAAVAKFARIPDDEGGGLEATLAKLEGKFRKSPVGSPRGPTSLQTRSADDLRREVEHFRLEQNQGEASHIGATPTPLAATKRLPEANEALQGGAGPKPPNDTVTKSLYAASEDSYNPVPLIERDVSNGYGSKTKASPSQADAVIPRRPPFDRSASSYIEDEYPDPLPDMEEMSNVRRGRYRSSVPTATTDSFLLDDDESLSDLSSDLSDGEIGTNSVLDDAYSTATQQIGATSLPPNVEYASGYLPSPPMTNENGIALKSESVRIEEQRRPPTPEASPVSRVTDSSRGRTPGEVDGSVLQPFANKVHQFPTRRHIPFVLAFDAVTLAQQLTIVERDALNEINWQDLVDMRWNNASSTTLNWVEYLHYSDPTGIELVTARFNLVVKWAQSEIVLTHNTEERALTMIKFIHIAQYARKVHNYATMLQLVIAMTSIDCSRLERSWALVPEADRTALREMEKLVSPLRNFHNLRAEMDAENLEDGCIPVVGKCLRS